VPEGEKDLRRVVGKNLRVKTGPFFFGQRNCRRGWLKRPPLSSFGEDRGAPGFGKTVRTQTEEGLGGRGTQGTGEAGRPWRPKGQRGGGPNEDASVDV